MTTRKRDGMMKVFKRLSVFNIFLYFGGFMITTLGINLLIRSGLGAGPWDAVTYNLHSLIQVSLGMASALVSASLILFIVLYRRKLRFLIILIPAFSIALTLDFWDILIFKDFYPELWFLRTVFYIFGIYTITLGLALIVSTQYPAMIFEELTLALMQMLNVKQFAVMRLGIELFAITLALLFGFLANIGFGAVNLGSIVVAFTIAPILDLQIRFIFAIRKQSYLEN